MALQSIVLYLKRFSNIQPPEKHIKEAIQEILHTEFSLKLPPEKIKIQKNKIYLTLHPVIRSELHLKRNELTEKVHAQLQKTYSLH